MKKIYKLIMVITIMLSVGCVDDLERLPLDQLVEETTFTSNSNFESYAWGFYSIFNPFSLGYVNQDWNSDLLVSSNNNNGQNWLHQRIIVPASSNDYTAPYETVRRANIMLRNIDNPALSETQQRHWKSVALFFRAVAYFDLLKKYGGVIWVEDYIGEDSELLQAPRDSRELVASNILRDLNYAVENINEDGSADNSVDTDVVNAFLSRFALFEGTWRKYHNLEGEELFLRSSAEAAEAVMAGKSISGTYDELFNSDNLKSNTNVLLYREHVDQVLTHALTSRHRNSAGNWDLTKKAADMYLYKDGTPVGANPDFVGGAMLERDPYTEFRDRDERMLVTIVPPFRVQRNVGGNQRAWDFHDNPKHREYIDVIPNIVGNTTKQLPSSNWTGFIVGTSPHFRDFNEGHGFNVTRTGYKSFKYFDQLNTGRQNNDLSDAPVFRLGEVLLNYAEAKFELGEFNQSVADQTISPLRARAGVAPLNITSITEDPRRDPSVDPILWEIRRERAIELMFEGDFRWQDLRRWRKMDYAAEKKLGRWIVASDYNNRLPVDGGAEEGYISYWPTPPTFPDHYYLFPIPSDELLLNPNLEQNPGW
ncbi:MAG: RagB/SusD family nutrient uptake outer membrane protein [Arenibacter latericius]|nr:RagB/SusD family nutrient uptake outer membrane protein [Arenibacter latericius]